jgi:hypothetical protein
MYLPGHLEDLMATRHADLLAEAAAERLASQVSPARQAWRSHLAEALYHLAIRLDPCAAPARLTGEARRAANSVWAIGE